MVWTVTVVVLESLFTIAQSTLYCIETDNVTHSEKQKVAMQIQAGLVLVINPVIVSIVLKHLYGRVSF